MDERDATGTVIENISDKASEMQIMSPGMSKTGIRTTLEGKRIAVLASGRGSDFQAIVDANEKGDVSLEIAILISNEPAAFAIERAKKHSIPYVVIEHRGRTREEFESILDGTLRQFDIGLVVLAGFMRVLSPSFVIKWQDRIINIHPALLPSFPGAHAQRDALEYGVKVSGLTIHFVDEEVDHGPIIFQLPVKVSDDDDEETLSKRILEEEHKWYPRVIQWIVDGRVVKDGRMVRILK
ncbi:MAG: phosphoribosylglycinamide formyltransferase [Thermoplasmatota archaeon]